MAEKIKLGVLVSGSGTNLQAIIDACEKGEIDAEVRVVVSDKAQAYALERAKKHRIPFALVKRKLYSSREDFDAAIVEILKKHEVELVCLAGFMRVVTKLLIDAFPRGVLNIHPGLLPQFPGLHAQKQAIEWGVKISGCTVHFVDEKVDHGPIIIQAAVPVLEDDTEERLQERILQYEHKIYPGAIQLVAEGRCVISGRRVKIQNPAEAKESIVNPPLKG